MHHFSHDSRVSLYKKVRNSLKNDGCYIECDYVAKDLAEEDFFFNESDKIRKSENIASEVLIHFDTPCCVETQLRLFREAGFRTQEKLWQVGQTAVFRSKK